MAGRRVVVRNNLVNPLKGDEACVMVAVDQAGEVAVSLYDRTGRLVGREAKALSVGVAEFCWGGLRDSGQPVPSGIYLALVETPGWKELTRIIVVK